MLDAPLQLFGYTDSGDRSQNVAAAGTLFFRDGTRYRVSMYNGGGVVGPITDRNGNKTDIKYQTVADLGSGAALLRSHQGVQSTTDSLGRAVNIVYGTISSPCDQITFNGYTGTPRTVQVCYSTLRSLLAPGLSPTSDYQEKTLQQLFPKLNIALDTGNPYDQLVVSGVVLPDLTKYQFYYNNHAEVARMVLPTGGKIEYAYGPGNPASVPQNGADGEFGESFNTWIGGQTGIYRRVTERRTYPDGVTLEGKTVYSASVGTDATNCPGIMSNRTLSVTADHQDASSVSIAKDKHYYCGDPGDIQSLAYSAEIDPFSFPRWREGREYATEETTTGGTVLRRVDETFQQRATIAWWGTTAETQNRTQDEAPPRDPRKTQSDTTLKDVTPNLMSRQTFSYDSYTNPTDVAQYDFGQGSPGSLLREVHTDYVTGASYTTGSIYLPSLPQQQRVHLGSTDYARTTFEFDVYTGGTCTPSTLTCHAVLTPRSGIVQMDTAYSTGGERHRGNATAVQRWLSGSTTDTFTYQKYDIAGNIVEAIDANGNSTTIDYDSAGAKWAFPTTITNPLSQTTVLSYDPDLGRVHTITDSNSKVTTLAYSDALDRLTSASRASLLTTTFAYPDAVTVQTNADVSAPGDGLNKRVVLYDGLGREKESRQYVDTNTCVATDAYVKVQKQYDAMGRLKSVSNPVCASATPDLTSTSYDALGRVTDVVAPGSATTHTDYSGMTATTTDPASKTRAATTDVLGRQKRVVESGTYTTDYTFDALDHLTCVSQGGQLRVIDYDTLGRVISVDNPETRTQAITSCSPGDPANRPTIKYTYDKGGNLLSKTDTANSTISYVIDKLNRVTSKTSADGIVQFVFDQDLAITGETDPNSSTGRLSSVTFGMLSTTYRYDALGRAKSSKQIVDDAANPYIFHYDWVPAGLSAMKYPTPRQVSTTYDSAGRPNGVTGYASGLQWNSQLPATFHPIAAM